MFNNQAFISLKSTGLNLPNEEVYLTIGFWYCATDGATCIGRLITSGTTGLTKVGMYCFWYVAAPVGYTPS